MQAYNNDKEFLHMFFDYKNEESSYPERLNELAGRNLKEHQLAEQSVHSWNHLVFPGCRFAYQ